MSDIRFDLSRSLALPFGKGLLYAGDSTSEIRFEDCNPGLKSINKWYDGGGGGSDGEYSFVFIVFYPKCLKSTPREQHIANGRIIRLALLFAEWWNGSIQSQYSIIFFQSSWF